ncbi:MAG: hypothetical protein NTY22_07725 [Proteobacteria bacterium]|nr:hypothetical protein [Pseudomonadota bacterium]
MEKDEKDKNPRYISRASKIIKLIQDNDGSPDTEDKDSHTLEEHKVDYDYWISKDCWTILQAASLISGHDPKGLLQDNDKIIDLIKTAIKAGTFNNIDDSVEAFIVGKLKPVEVIKWAQAKQLYLKVPNELITLVKVIGEQTHSNALIDLNAVSMSLGEDDNILIKYPGGNSESVTHDSLYFKFKNKPTKEWETFKEILNAQDHCIDIGKPSSKPGQNKNKILQEISKKLNKYFNTEDYIFFVTPSKKPPSYRQFTIKPIIEYKKSPYTRITKAEHDKLLKLKDKLLEHIEKLLYQRDICPDVSEARVIDKEVKELIISGIERKTLTNEEAEKCYIKMSPTPWEHHKQGIHDDDDDDSSKES